MTRKDTNKKEATLLSSKCFGNQMAVDETQRHNAEKCYDVNEKGRRG